MKINKVTITGADNGVFVEDLKHLSEEFPFAEWGILFSGNPGRERYPDMEWKMTAEKHLGNLSAHLCGAFSRAVLEKEDFDIITTLHPSYKRVQLNYNFSRSNGWNLETLLEYAHLHPEREIILQYNKSNAKTLNSIIGYCPDNIEFLYDASGGRGTEIQSISPPIGKAYTGYAGGISVENIDEICHLITDHKNSSACWIDLESGARTNNQFDLAKVRKILEESLPYIER